MNLLLYPHSGSGNHGCEAIVRSTLKIIGANNSLLLSSAPEEDKLYELDKICNVTSNSERLRKNTMLYWKAFLKFHLLNNKKAFDVAHFSPVFKEASNKDIALSIGGDNYCYGVPGFIYIINKEFKKKNIKTILWGCSIEPSSIDNEMMKDLNTYSWIFARESITYNALLDNKLINVFLIPDSAFKLNRIDAKLPDGFILNNTVGINISPMVMNYEKEKGITMLNYVRLIEYIIDSTDMQIALIPHVVWKSSDDRIPLKMLYDKFRSSRRVILIDDAPAEVLKGYIARCRFMVASRTHASIAAYSEEIPTLVVGYSVKARGIARDIFGTEENYIMPVQSLMNDNDMKHAFQWLEQHEKDIRMLYSKVMPSYKQKLIEGVKLLKILGCQSF